MALAIRPVAWVSSLSGLALTSIVWNDVCGTGIAHLMWFLIGPVALISMLVLVVRSPMLWERLAGIVVIVLGAVPNLIIMAGIMLGGLATC